MSFEAPAAAPAPAASRQPAVADAWRVGALVAALAALAGVLPALIAYLAPGRDAAIAAALCLGAPLAAWTIWRRPTAAIGLLLVLAVFFSEYSQTEWGVRSAEQLTTLYNARLAPGIFVSVFDAAFAAIVVLLLSRKLVRGEALLLPRPAIVAAVGAAAAATLYGVLLGGAGLQVGYDLYHVLREVRPLVYGLLLLLLAADTLARRPRPELWMNVALAVCWLRGIQGVARHLAGVGRDYHGTRMVFYDYSDSLALGAALFLIAARLATRPLRPRRLILWGLAAAPMVYTFVFSYRRSFWVGAAVALPFLLLGLPRRERLRLTAIGILAVLPVAAAVAMLFLDSLPVQVALQRVESIPDTEVDASNYFRILDQVNALEEIGRSGALGHGFGGRYRVVAREPWLDEFLDHVSRASHNGYLYLVMKIGIPGLLAWSALWLGVLAAALRARRSAGSDQRAFVLAAAATLVMCAVANLFMPLYYNLRPMLLLALLAAAVLALDRPSRSRAASAR